MKEEEDPLHRLRLPVTLARQGDRRRPLQRRRRFLPVVGSISASSFLFLFLFLFFILEKYIDISLAGMRRLNGPIF
jgi:hypothetical protein